MKYSLKKIQEIVKKNKIIINNRKKKLGRESIVKEKYIIMSAPFQKFINGGSSGEGCKGWWAPPFFQKMY